MQRISFTPENAKWNSWISDILHSAFTNNAKPFYFYFARNECSFQTNPDAKDQKKRLWMEMIANKCANECNRNWATKTKLSKSEKEKTKTKKKKKNKKKDTQLQS